MTHTTVALPEELRERAERSAEEMGISLDEFIRGSVEERIDNLEARRKDPLFAYQGVYTGPAPSDLAANHDFYLYGDKD